MTTEPRPLGRWGGAAVLALLAWAGLLAGTTATLGRGAVVAIGPPDALIRDADPHGLRVVAASGLTLRAEAQDAAAIRSLYRAGAWLVLPVGRFGCGLARSPGSR